VEANIERGAFVEMPEEHRQQVENIVAGMKIRCPKGLACCRSGFKGLPKVRSVGSYELLECLDEQCRACILPVSFGGGIYCTCPARKYIAKTLHL